MGFGDHRGGGVLLGILGGGVPPCSSNPGPISDQQKCHFPYPFSDYTFIIHNLFRPGLQVEIMLSLLRLERKQKKYANPFSVRIFLFFSCTFEIETVNTFIHSVVPSKTIPDSRPKWALPDGAAHTSMVYIKKYPPPLGSDQWYNEVWDDVTCLFSKCHCMIGTWVEMNVSLFIYRWNSWNGGYGRSNFSCAWLAIGPFQWSIVFNGTIGTSRNGCESVGEIHLWKET